MAQPFPAIQTISSIGVTAGVFLDPTARFTNVFLTGPTTTADVTLQATLDGPDATTKTWVNTSTTHLAYSAGNEGVAYTFLSPIYGLRLGSSVLTSSSVTMKVLQSIIG